MTKPSLRTFSEYLALSMTNPNLLRSPYTREHRRIIAYMTWLKQHLVNLAPPPEKCALVSVIVPTHNRAKILRRALLSVLTQSMPRFELLVVDDGSTDETVRLVNSFGDERIRLIQCATNRGAAHARNIGLEAARGKYIAYLDSDDWWDQHFLLVMLSQTQVMDHRFAYSAQRVVRPAGQLGVTRRPELIRFAPYNAALLENNNYISQIAVLHDRSLANEAGGFNEAYKKFVDWEFILRVSEASSPLAVPVILSHYNQCKDATVTSSFNGAKYLRQLRNDLASSSIDSRTLMSAPSVDERADSRRLQPPYGLSKSVTDSTRTRLPKKTEEDPPYTVHCHSSFFALRRQGSAVLRKRSLIVIPSYGVPVYLRLCLSSILRFSDSGSFRVLVVDNASDRPVQDVLEQFEQVPDITVLRNPTNLGFSRAVQQGMELAEPGEDVVIMNNDAVVTPGWLNELSAVAHRYADAGIVAPRQVLLANDPGLRMHVPGAMLDFEVDVNLSSHHRNVIDPYFDTHNNVIELDFVPFFCVLVRRDVIDAIGPVSPNMGVHYQSDWVYSDAVRRSARRRILHTAQSKVYHFGGGATQELRSRDSKTFETMGVREDWRAVASNHGRRSRT